jgi:5-formyltetrahydrofolate cyclo-ligase
LTKAEARNHIRQQRKQLSDEAYQRINDQLQQRVLDFLAKTKPALVHCFLPILKNREVNTWPLIHWLQARQIRVAVPKSDRESNTMQHFLLAETTRCPENTWGIPEPEGDALVRIDEKAVDLVLLPLLAFDSRGTRVGYGKGYYDRFLAHCRPEAIKAGLSLFPPVADITDASPLDIPLDVAITPDKVWVFAESGGYRP